VHDYLVVPAGIEQGRLKEAAEGNAPPAPGKIEGQQVGKYQERPRPWA
jgi:hypothetical protein